MPRAPSQIRFLAAGLALIAATAWSQDAAEWVSRMNEAVETLNYRGVYAHMQGTTVENLQIVHAYENGRVSERILSLDGAGREMIREGDTVRCIYPDTETVILEDSAHENPLSTLPDYSEAVAANYDFALHETQRVADRRTNIVSITPRDKLRYGYRLWLDSDTAMPLKSELIDENGTTVEQVHFSRIEIVDSIPEFELKSTINTEGFQLIKPPSIASKSLNRMSLVARDLPTGFSLSASSKGPMAGSHLPVEHYVVSDRLATVSVFVKDPNSTDDVASGFARLGTANAYSTTIAGRQVTAIGEVPRPTLEAIANSFRDE